MHPFIESMAMRNSVKAALAQGKSAKVYADDGQKEKRSAFRKDFKAAIRHTVANYSHEIMKEPDWCNLLISIRDPLQVVHAEVLRNGILTIGVVQKAFSLYLKYTWLVGDSTKKPYYPPLDSRVISETRKFQHKEDKYASFKKLNDICVYCRIMQAVTKHAKNKDFGSATDWELGFWVDDDSESDT